MVSIPLEDASEVVLSKAYYRVEYESSGPVDLNIGADSVFLELLLIVMQQAKHESLPVALGNASWKCRA